MPHPIQRLSQDVIGQIAAGEVVERPAAAIKELVENSIDAGATAITVEIRDGGISYFRVTDNGAGIPAEQIRLAFERHATSKIVSASDLYAVQTLGFRGEALASIAAVSRVSCTTRTPDAPFGVCARVEAGETLEVREAASPGGTSLVIKDLFFNAPVRLKFLKKPATEAGFVSDYMLRLILSHPEISFRYVSQGKTLYHSAGDGKLESAVYCVYGRETLSAMKRVEGAESGVLVSGFLGVGDQARGNRLHQSFFLNGRYFRDMELSKAIEGACQGSVTIGRYPIFVLSLQMPYELADVNVHPNKLEVRFQKPEAVAACLVHAVTDALTEHDAKEALLAGKTPVMDKETKPDAEVVCLLEKAPPEENKPATEDRAAAKVLPALRNPIPVASVIPPTPTLKEALPRPEWTRALPPVSTPAPIKAVSASESRPPRATASASSKPEQPSFAPQTEEPLRYLGVLFKTYLLFETGERFLMIDQHAAHERILYDRLMRLHQDDHEAQHLLSPQLLLFTPHECALLMEYRQELSDAGFEIEPFDETSVSVHTVPTILGQNFPVRELLTEALDQLSELHGKITHDRVRAMVAQMACKRAIKAGDSVSEQDVRYLVREMLKTGVAPTCPHGRPLVVEWSKMELEKRFKRIQ